MVRGRWTSLKERRLRRGTEALQADRVHSMALHMVMHRNSRATKQSSSRALALG